MLPVASENTQVTKDLFGDVIRRVLKPDAVYLLIVDGSKALRCCAGGVSIDDIFGDRARVQRCRTHYADHRIMPTAGWGMRQAAGIALEASA